jgi:hypothetical protein
LEENITIEIHASTGNPLKADVKEQLLDHISQELSRHSGKNVEFKDFYYVDQRSAEAFQGLIVIIQAIVPFISVAAAALSLRNSIRQTKGKPRIMVKRKDGSFVELIDRMTEKEVNDALNIGRNEEEGSKTEI